MKTLVLTDGLQIVVTDAQAIKIDESINTSTDGFIRVNGNLIKKTTVARIENGGKTEVDVIQEDRRIAPPDNRGKESPAKNAIQEYLRVHGTMKGYKAN